MGFSVAVKAFLPRHSGTKNVHREFHPLFSLPRRGGVSQTRRKEMISHNGPYFNLDRMGGTVEFGATANLVTQLEQEAKPDEIATWLKDGRGLALSIWDEEMIQELGESLYRLNVMTLQFVTLQLSPWVDMEIKTVQDKNGAPVFTLQSVDFDPNIQVFPGMKMSSESLGIVIEVFGFLRPSRDNTGVAGTIAFRTTGKLPPPLMVLPQSVLKTASDTINKTIVDFAIKSFQNGAKAKYQEFRSKELTQ